MRALLILAISMIFILNAEAGPVQEGENQYSRPMHVVLLNPGGDHWFWKMIISYMRAAAEDLNTELEVITSDWDHLLTIQQAREVVQRKDPPDFIITGNEKSNAGEIIKIADRAGVDIFLFSNGFVDPQDIELYGGPREKYKHWIGQLIPNNYSAGYQMGKVLIARASELNLRADDGTIHMAAIAGARKTHASVERMRGLNAALSEHPGSVKLLQTAHGNWTAKRAEEISERLFRRFPDIGVLWGVNDTTAFGAMKVAAALGRSPGEDIVFGGCGWHADAIQKVKNGTLATTVGGHFMEAGWSIVLLYDYHHGRDFFSDSIETSMFSIDRSNVEKFLKVFGEQDWRKIDFREFSKVHNPHMSTYDFSLEAVMRQF